MNSDQLFEIIKVDAIRLNQMNGFGALHIFVADGNCEDHNLEFCLGLPNITEEEREWCQHMYDRYTEEQRYAVWAFAQCPDLRTQIFGNGR